MSEAKKTIELDAEIVIAIYRYLDQRPHSEVRDAMRYLEGVLSSAQQEEAQAAEPKKEA